MKRSVRNYTGSQSRERLLLATASWVSASYAGMVNIGESVIKAVNKNKRNQFKRLSQKARKQEECLLATSSWSISFPAKSRHLTLQTYNTKRGNPEWIPKGTVIRKKYPYPCRLGIAEKANDA